MRDILFRAKRIDTGEWVIGYYQRTNEAKHNHTIVIPYRGYIDWEYEIAPETVSQYTGMTDSEGNKIFEGDILSGERYRDYGQTGEYVEDKQVVKWNEKKCGFDPMIWFDGYSHDIKWYKVVGNVFDNPDMAENGI